MKRGDLCMTIVDLKKNTKILNFDSIKSNMKIHMILSNDINLINTYTSLHIKHKYSNKYRLCTACRKHTKSS